MGMAHAYYCRRWVQVTYGLGWLSGARVTHCDIYVYGRTWAASLKSLDLSFFDEDLSDDFVDDFLDDFLDDFVDVLSLLSSASVSASASFLLLTFELFLLLDFFLSLSSSSSSSLSPLLLELVD